MSASRLCRIGFVCNDGRNGQFFGRAYACYWTTHTGGWYVDLEPIYVEGARFKVDDRMLKFELDGVAYPFVRSAEWVGNWCWNEYTMKRPAAVQLLKDMVVRGGWSCTQGPSRIFDLLKYMEPPRWMMTESRLS